MINLSLPIRPRTEGRCERLVTPISISLATEGEKILCLSDLRSGGTSESSEKYVKLVSEKVGVFDRILTDSDPELLNFSEMVIFDMIPIRETPVTVLTCRCGKYEELKGVRMFDLKQVQNGRCVFCDEVLYEETKPSLLADIHWPTSERFTFNRGWVGTDLAHFLARQVSTYKISKDDESWRVHFGGGHYGVRHQVLWASLLANVGSRTGNKITVHYVNRVQDKVFFVAGLATMLSPELRIHLQALPAVWVDDSPTMDECRPSHIKLIGKALNTKRKDIRASLKSWRH